MNNDTRHQVDRLLAVEAHAGPAALVLLRAHLDGTLRLVPLRPGCLIALDELHGFGLPVIAAVVAGNGFPADPEDWPALDVLRRWAAVVAVFEAPPTAVQMEALIGVTLNHDRVLMVGTSAATSAVWLASCAAAIPMLFGDRA